MAWHGPPPQPLLHSGELTTNTKDEKTKVLAKSGLVYGGIQYEIRPSILYLVSIDGGRSHAKAGRQAGREDDATGRTRTRQGKRKRERESRIDAVVPDEVEKMRVDSWQSTIITRST